MNAAAWISKITFSDQTELSLSKNDVVVFVGPNNSGKSASLKESARLLERSEPGKVVRSIKIEKDGNETALTDLLNQTAVFREDHYRGPNFTLYRSTPFECWKRDKLGELHTLFACTLTTEQRLTAANPPDSIRITQDPLTHPIYHLQKYDNLENTFSDHFRQAFNTDLIVHRNAGSQVPLYVGERPKPKEGQDRTSVDYLRELESLDLLHEQGDGMRSFVGVMLNAFVSKHSILFIDEPEAFLHPPQARLLGKMLSGHLPSQRQLFLSTHSEDFLKGILDSGGENIKIVRIQREHFINKISILQKEDIKNVWSDSLLRHSNILAGLFHAQVVICESDSDCRFYSSILSTIEDTGKPLPDTLFIHCGGKHRLHTVIRALRQLSVKISVIMDFDILSDTNPLRVIFETAGGKWSEIEKLWKQVKCAIDGRRPELGTAEFKDSIKQKLEGITTASVQKSDIAEIQKLLKSASPWTMAKEAGKAFIPSGDATVAYETLSSRLKEKGLYIVEVGQLESFDKSVGNHGPKWVSEVLNKDLRNDSSFESAKSFMREVASIDH